MLISKKKWRALEKRVADLEIKSQQQKVSFADRMGVALKEVLPFGARQMQESQHPPIVLEPLEPIASLIRKGN